MLSKTLAHLQRQFAASYEVSSTIRHKGEKGRQRENGLLTLLREHLPMAYGVATGEIVPYNDAPNSPQCDIIIYDHLHYPILGKSQAVQLIPYEAVYCVIECKSIITTKELKDAEAKFKAILQMPKCTEYTITYGNTRMTPAFAVFGYKLGMKTQTVTKRLYKEDPEYFVASLDEGIGVTLGDAGKADFKSVWMNTTDHKEGRYETLAWFFYFLLYVMGTVDLGTPNYGNILFGEL